MNILRPERKKKSTGRAWESKYYANKVMLAHNISFFLLFYRARVDSSANKARRVRKAVLGNELVTTCHLRDPAFHLDHISHNV